MIKCTHGVVSVYTCMKIYMYEDIFNMKYCKDALRPSASLVYMRALITVCRRTHCSMVLCCESKRTLCVTDLGKCTAHAFECISMGVNSSTRPSMRSIATRLIELADCHYAQLSLTLGLEDTV